MSQPFLTVYLYDKNNVNPIATFPHVRDITWQDDLYDTGSFSIKISSEDAKALSQTMICDMCIRISYGLTSDNFVFAGIIESIQIDRVNVTEESTQDVIVTGRGIRARLEDALVWYASNSSKGATRTWSNKSAGQIFRSYLTAAQARGVLTGMSVDFTDSLDSDGNAFTNMMTIEDKAGTNLLDISKTHADTSVDVYVTPDNIIQYYNSKGSDISNSCTFRAGRDFSQLNTELTGPVKNNVLMYGGDNKFTNYSDSSSISTYGRRETYLELGSVKSTSQKQLNANATLKKTATPSDGVVLSLSRSTPYVAYQDYSLGDTVGVVTDTGLPVKYRIRTITGNLDSSGFITFVPELGTARDKLVEKLTRQLNKLAQNSASGNSVDTSVDVLDSSTKNNIKVKGTGQIGDYAATTGLLYRQFWGEAALDTTGATGFDANTYFMGNTIGETSNWFVDYGQPIAINPDSGKDYNLVMRTAVTTTGVSGNAPTAIIVFGGNVFIQHAQYWQGSTRSWVNPWLSVTGAGSWGGSDVNYPHDICTHSGKLWSASADGFSRTANPGMRKAPSLLMFLEASPTTFSASHFPALSGTYYDTPYNPVTFTSPTASVSSGLNAGGDYLWMFGYQWNTALSGFVGAYGWWYTPAYFSLASTWVKHSGNSNQDKGLLQKPAIDTNGHLYTIDSSSNVVKLTNTGSTVTYSAATVWPSGAAPNNFTSTSGWRSGKNRRMVTHGLGDLDGTILFCGAVNGAYVNSLTLSGVPAIWRFDPALGTASLIWVGTKHIGPNDSTAALGIKLHPDGTGYTWTVAGGNSNDTYVYNDTI